METDNLECEVYINDVLVGTLMKMESGTTIFNYDAEYVAKGGRSIAPSLPTSQRTHAHRGLHPFFSNLLSEGWLKAQHDALLKMALDKSLPDTDRISEFDGFVYFSHYFGSQSLRGGRIAPVKPLKPAWIAKMDWLIASQIPAGKTMLPGVQPKLYARKNAYGVFEACNADVATHIAKRQFDQSAGRAYERRCSIVQNELLTVCASSILNPNPKDEIVNVRLAEVEGFGDSLLVERFDLKKNGHTPRVLDFCQLLGLPPERKGDSFYSRMTDFIKSHANSDSDNHFPTDIEDVKFLISRLLRNILVGNIDTHLKNFSLMEVDGKWRLTPDYDLVCDRAYKLNALALFFDTAKWPPKSKEIDPATGDFKYLDKLSREMRDNRRVLIGDIKHQQLRAFLDSFGITKQEQRDILSGFVGRIKPTIEFIQSFSYAPADIKKVMVNNIQARWNEAFQPLLNVLEKECATQADEVKPVLPVHIPATASVGISPALV